MADDERTTDERLTDAELRIVELRAELDALRADTSWTHRAVLVLTRRLVSVLDVLELGDRYRVTDGGTLSPTVYERREPDEHRPSG